MDCPKQEEAGSRSAQSKYSLYRIYLVGFPDIAETSKGASVAKLIDGLVPEAEIILHSIFRHDAAPDPLGSDLEVGGDAEEDGSGISEEDNDQPGRNKAVGNMTAPASAGPLSDGRGKSASDGGDGDGTRCRAIKRINTRSPSTASAVRDAHDLSPGWLEKEAVGLLDRIEKHRCTGGEGVGDESRSPVLLAGHGFGGLVVKQAVIMANTLPRFNRVALNLEGLVFFSTPHRSTSRLSWEEVLLAMIRRTGKNFRGRLSEMLSELIDSVSQLSHVFYQFTSKYPTANFILSGQSDHPLAMTFSGSNCRETIIQWTDHHDGGHDTAESRTTDEFEELQVLRAQFAPQRLLLKLRKEAARLDERALSQPPLCDTYFGMLQALSPCRGLLHETRVSVGPDEFRDLGQMFRPLLRGVRFQKVRGGSVQVTGPPGCGKSGLVKVLTGRLRRESSVVVVEHVILSNSQHRTESLYGVLCSFLHQVISQRPSMFNPVEDLVARILKQRVWSDRAIHVLLSSMLTHAENIDLLVVIYDMEAWPASVLFWWRKLHHWLPSSSKCTFLISSRTLDENLAPGNTLHLDLESQYDRYKRDLIKARIRRHGEQLRGSPFDQAVRRDIFVAAHSFQGSFTAIGSYLTRLFQSFTLRAPRAMRIAISGSCQTEQQFYRRELEPLFTPGHSPALFWTIPTLSWVLNAARPLHVQELAAAAAIDLRSGTKQDMRENISVDMERDLKGVLDGILSIENRRVRFVNPVAKSVLLEVSGAGRHVKLDTHYRLTLHCLHYLDIVLADDSPREWEQCLSYVSTHRRQQTGDPPDPVLEFLHYACLFWPAHFLQAEQQPNDNWNLVANVAEFLQRPTVADRWFDLHLLCMGIATRAGGNDDKVDARKRAVQMAGYVDLGSVVAYLSGDADDPTTGTALDTTTTTTSGTTSIHAPVRRGRAQHNVVLDTLPLDYCLDAVIANDDYEKVVQLLQSHQKATTTYFPLHAAALAGSLRTVRALFSSMGKVPRQNDDGETPLHLAAAGGHLDVVRLLLGKDDEGFSNETKGTGREGTCGEEGGEGGSVPSMLDAPDFKDQTPLTLATTMGHVEVARYLVSIGAGLLVRDRHGKTALHYAVDRCPQVVESIVGKEPASLLVQDDSGRTPLHIAAQINSGASASVMVRAASDSGHLHQLLQALDNGGKTALHCAAESGAGDVARILGENDPDRRRTVAVRDLKHQNVPAELAARCGQLDVMQLIASWTPDTPSSHLLLAASEAGQLLAVHYLLRNGCSPDGPEPDGPRPLSLAASEGHEAVVLALLESKARVNLPDLKRQTALHHASAEGRCHVVRTLLAWDSPSTERAHLDTPDCMGYTPLHLAAQNGHLEAMALLIDRGADIEARSREGQNPLHLAIKHAQAVTFLLDKGAAINNKDALGQTPLSLAAHRNHVESAKALISRGADLNAQDDRGMAPLSYAIKENDLAMVEVIFEASPDAFRNQIWDNLKLAVECLAADVARFIIKRPPDVLSAANDQVDDELLLATAKHDLADILLDLAALGVNVIRRCGPENRSALHMAAASGMVDNIRGLIELGAEVNGIDANGKTPLHYAARSGHAEVISVLLDRGAEINTVDEDHETPLWSAAYWGHIEAVNVLLNGGADVSLCDTDGRSPLHVSGGELEISRLLIQHKSDVNLQDKDGYSPMHLAVSWGSPETVQLLLEHGGDPNMVDHRGITPFHYALCQEDEKCARIMLNHRGNNTPGIDTPTYLSLAPIHMAIMNRTKSQVLPLLLLEQGAKTQVRTDAGMTCLSLAALWGQDEVLEILLGEAPGAGTWVYDDLVAAYWQGVLKAVPSPDSERCVKLLLDSREGGRLLKELSEEGGHNGLEAYLLRDRPGDGTNVDVRIPLLLLRRGINPFERRSPGQETAFELAIRAWGPHNNGFLEDCAAYIPRSLTEPSAEFGFRELRIATEIDTTGLWTKLESLMMHVEEEVDQDGWTIHHFLSQSAPRLEFARHKRPTTRELKTPTAIIWPSAWKVEYPDLGPGVEITADGREARFEGRKHPDNTLEGYLSIRADFPFPHRKSPLTLPYFEVTIEEVPGAVGSESGDDGFVPATVAVGLCGELVDLRDSHPGWYSWTVAFHGDDAMIYEEHGVEGKYRTGRSFGPGHTVGCGIDYRKGEYLFTLDGELVARHSSKLIYRKLYPCIGHSHGAVKVRVNFGTSDFAWKGAGELRAREGDGTSTPRVERAAAGW